MASRYSSGANDSSEQVHLMNEDENVTETPRLNRKSLVIFFGVVVVAAAIVVSTVMVTLYSGKGGPFSNKAARSSDKFNFEDIFGGRFSYAHYSSKWVSDDEYITHKAEGLVLINLTKNTSDVLLDEEEREQLGITTDWFSPDRRYILFTKHRQQQYRYSFKAEYHVYDTQTKTSIQLQLPGEDPSQIQYATWGEKKNCLVFVYGNDIFYMESPSSSSVKRLTNSGVEHKIFNGIPDWVYQEEVLNSDHALWFSPYSRYLAYIQFNDTRVNWYEFPWYGDRNNSYTSIRKIAYPKPGYPNPTVKVFVVDLKDTKRIELPEPTDFSNIDRYAVNVGWLSEKAVTVNWLNRDQNEAILHMCEHHESHFVCKQNSELTVQNGWVDDKYMTPLPSRDVSYYITLWPFKQSSYGNFIHVAKMSTHPQGYQTPVALTSGSWEVLKILAHDDNNQRVYFTASKESPTQSHVYSVDIRTKKLKCLTCNLPTLISGNKCSYYDASFSLKGSWYILSCRGPGIPEMSLRSTLNSKVVVLLEDNKELRKRLDGVALPKEKTYTVKNGDYDIYVKEYRPPDFREDKKYGVLFSVYGGPGSQKVVDSYGYGFESGYLVSNFDLIVVSVDARGTCCRGERFKHEVYKQLGKAEAEDTIAVARYIADNKPYVDKDKIAIWGWSYGGFLASYVLGQNSGLFKLGMAVAPVTDWRYYDSIYTERYMLTPYKNKEGYEISSVLPLAENFQNDNFLLVHGTGDDNVHFQNTAQLVAALTKAGVKYRVQFYPDKNHGLSGGGTSDHLYHLLTRFLVEKLSIGS